jgi:hypothetical protein
MGNFQLLARNKQWYGLNILLRRSLLSLVYHSFHHHPSKLVPNGMGFGKVLFQGVAQGKQCICCLRFIIYKSNTYIIS